ncbi:aminotransferase class I/II-fold pyridoxal phosphate-dependent enzyme [Terrilactibacillus sp. BCM23-1]|uniref:Aminotransferase class I/II-fold pyridoxal phosphate-dependent enzyme n=1 Tax=Terrilactibacillus tamarindi TaxID=2599694 RepID=A0A6N8CP14_9BACI|nr:aminotransferase class I/II-fold pyridoxal phosphate-dependent enzyme [Terrilactibacillus tamarindi]MTT31899.1 aminotransferase class I/II-fold pyridoxal phosphate-dependent enzyme [Terrilactibacillus tamarindi]
MVNFKASSIVDQLPPNYFSKIENKVTAYKEKGIDVINLASGSPDQPTPPHIVQALKDAIDRDDNRGYPPFRAKKNIREAISTFYKREYNVDIDPETEVTIFNGSTIGIVGIPQALLEPGDYLITTDPTYPIYYSAAKLARAEIFNIPVYEKDDFLPDYNLVPTDIAEKAKLLMINYPNNPTGAIATPDFFEKTIDFAKENQLPIMHDFAYGAFGFDGHKPLSLIQMPGGKEYGVETYTASKTYNMAGWRLGFAVGNASIIDALDRFHDHAFSNVFGAVQDAAAVALLSNQDSVKELAKLYEHRRNVLVQSMREIGWDVSAPKGSFFAWFKVPEGFTSRTFTEFLLDEVQVVVAPGEGFGKNGSQYVRLSLLKDDDRLREAANRIKKTGIFTTPLA